MVQTTLNKKNANRLYKGEDGKYHVLFNGIGAEELFVYLGAKSYSVSEVKDSKGVYRVKNAGDRAVIATIDKNTQTVYIHLGKSTFVGKRDFKVTHNGLLMFNLKHGEIAGTYAIADITEHINADNLKLPATEIVDLVNEEVEEYPEVEQLADSQQTLVQLTENVSESTVSQEVRGLINMVAQNFGDGVTFEVKGKALILTIVDLESDFGISKSGKSDTIASTRGNKTVPGTNIVVGLNVYKKRPIKQ